MENNVSGKAADSVLKSLFRVGGVAALIMVALVPIQIAAFVMAPQPASVADWFTLLQNNELLGLIRLDILLVVDYALFLPIFLALFFALRRTNESFIAIATVLGFSGAVIYIASNPAFSMLYLSNQYAATTADAQRSMLVAAGQAMLANFGQGTSYVASYILASIAPLIISVIMLRSKIFSKATAYTGIVANGLGLAIFVPIFGLYLSLISVVILQVWLILIALRLFKLT